MQPNGLPHQCRLHLKKDFKRVFQGGIKLQYNGVVMWAVPGKGNTTRPVRFAVVVSKKLGPAVVRNRAKRLLREAFRISKTQIIVGTDIIVSPREGGQVGSMHAAQQTLKTLCGQAALLTTSSENTVQKNH